MDNVTTELRHAGELLAELAQLRRDGHYCDVLLKPGNAASRPGEAASEASGVWAHRAVLAAASPVFYNMFYGSSEVCLMQIVYLRDVELETLRELVNNIYSASPLSVNVKKATAVLAAATMLEVVDVRDAASDCLVCLLAADNALRIHATGELYKSTALTTAASEYIDKHFEHVVQGDEFLALGIDELITLLNRDRPPAIEESILDAVLRWTQHCPQERRRHLLSLLAAVRLQLVPRHVLAARAGGEPLVSDPSALHQIIEALQPRSSPLPDMRPREVQVAAIQPRVMQQLDTQPHIQPHDVRPHDILSRDVQQADGQSRNILSTSADQLQVAAAPPADRHSAANAHVQTSPRPQQSPAALLVIGGVTTSGCTNSVVVRPLPAGLWQAAAPLPAARSGADAALLDGRVYLVGGRNSSWSTVDTVFVYDVANNSWSTGPAMTARRQDLGVAALAGRVYAAGGWGAWRDSNSAEAMDPREGRWRPVAPMETRRRSHGVAALDDKLYVVGGRSNNDLLDSVERYDPRADAWEAVEALSKRREDVVVGVLGDELYAVFNWNRSMERYRAGSGWRRARALPLARRGAAAAVDDSRLYVVGGLDGDRYMIQSVSVFDAGADMWSKLPECDNNNAGDRPDIGRDAAAAIVVPWTPTTPQN